MLKHILTYLAVLAAAAVFAIFYYRWFSWVLFWIIAALPWVSLLLSLPFMITAACNGAIPVCDETVVCGDDFRIGVTGKKGRRVFCIGMQLRLRAENRFTRFKIKLPLRRAGWMDRPAVFVRNGLSNHCGNVELRALGLRFYDFTGIFFIPVRLKSTCRVLVLPRPEKPALLPDSGAVPVIGYRPKSGGGFSDDYELRPYREGDSLRLIHWKLSSKHDELLVREPSVPVTQKLALCMELSHDLYTDDGILARFVYVCRRLYRSGVTCYCRLPSDKLFAVKSEEELRQFLRLFFDNAPSSLAGDNDAKLLYILSDKGEEVRQL